MLSPITKKWMFTLAGLGMFFALHAQSQVDNAWNRYPAIVTQVKYLTGQTADRKSIQQAISSEIAKLDSFLAVKTDSTARFAQALKVMYQFVYAQSLTAQERDSALNMLADTINRFDAERFPMVFEVTETNRHSLYWSDFAPIQAEINMAHSARYFDKGDWEQALLSIERCLSNDYLRTDQSAVSFARKLHILRIQKAIDQDMLDAALLGLENYADLNQEERKAGGALLDTLPEVVAQIVPKLLNASPELSQNGAIWAQASRLMLNCRRNGDAVVFAAKAAQAGYNDQEFLLAAVPIAVQSQDRPNGLLLLEKLEQVVSESDCSMRSKLATWYDEIGQTERAVAMRKQVANCERKVKQYTQTNKRDGGLYLGGYVYPLFRRDLGGVVAIQTKKVLVEASWQSLWNRRDKLYDLRLRGVDGSRAQEVRWNGYYTHLAINRVKGNRGARSYMGVLFGYNERNFDAFNVPRITDKETGDEVGNNQTFSPVERRYILMYNSGTHSYGRILAADFYFSFGGAYCEFERGNVAYEDNRFDFNNPMLDNRRSGRFVMMARIGLTMGIQVGPRTFSKR